MKDKEREERLWEKLEMRMFLNGFIRVKIESVIFCVVCGFER